VTRHDIKLNTKTIFTAPVSLWFFFRLQLEAQVSRTYLLTYLLTFCVCEQTSANVWWSASTSVRG